MAESRGYNLRKKTTDDFDTEGGAGVNSGDDGIAEVTPQRDQSTLVQQDMEVEHRATERMTNPERADVHPSSGLSGIEGGAIPKTTRPEKMTRIIMGESGDGEGFRPYGQGSFSAGQGDGDHRADSAPTANVRMAPSPHELSGGVPGSSRYYADEGASVAARIDQGRFVRLDMHGRGDDRRPDVRLDRNEHYTPVLPSYSDVSQSHGLKLKLPVYDGKSEWEPFWLQFNFIAQQYGWNAHTEHLHLMGSLRDIALQYVSRLPATTCTTLELSSRDLEPVLQPRCIVHLYLG